MLQLLPFLKAALQLDLFIMRIRLLELWYACPEVGYLGDDV